MLEVANELKVIFSLRHILLHFGVGLSNDGQEHIEKDEKDEENVDDEV